MGTHRGGVEDDLEMRADAGGVVAQRDVDVVAEVGQFPGGAFDQAGHAAASFACQSIAAVRVEQVDAGLVAQPSGQRAQGVAGLQIGGHRFDDGAGGVGDGGVLRGCGSHRDRCRGQAERGERGEGEGVEGKGAEAFHVSIPWRCLRAPRTDEGGGGCRRMRAGG
ncbi:hypothetical protein FKV24_006175 [Lysobacter maris]|uniref:Uncharacterized protein n=1 Tax=Marilutibacter maris TaxID=1605891 RepID=A0A508AV35_9GAMM|nr:hypothetical protein FKV24_006175 [Lysobacter maris]